MEELQKTITQLLKANMDQQQKFELVIELHKQQLEFQQFALQKTEQQQKRLEEFLVNSLNCSKNSEKDTIFSQSTIYNSIDTFEYVPENDKTFLAFYRCYEDIFNEMCEQWPSKNKKGARLILRKVGTTEHNWFVDFILSKKNTDLNFSETVKLQLELYGPNTTLFHKCWKCLNTVKDNQQDFLTFAASVNKLCNDFKLAKLRADDFKSLIFAQGLVSAEDAEVRRQVLIKLENEQGQDSTLRTMLTETVGRVTRDDPVRVDWCVDGKEFNLGRVTGVVSRGQNTNYAWAYSAGRYSRHHHAIGGWHIDRSKFV